MGDRVTEQTKASVLTHTVDGSNPPGQGHHRSLGRQLSARPISLNLAWQKPKGTQLEILPNRRPNFTASGLLPDTSPLAKKKN